MSFICFIGQCSMLMRAAQRNRLLVYIIATDFTPYGFVILILKFDEFIITDYVIARFDDMPMRPPT